MKQKLSICAAIGMVLLGLYLIHPDNAHAATVAKVFNGGTGVGTFTTGLIGGSGINNLFTQATTTVSCSGSTSCTSFVAIGPSPITITSSGGGSGNVATSSAETKGQLPYWTSTGATPATLGGVATSSFAAGTGLSYSGTLGALVGGAAGTLTNTGVISLGNGTGTTCSGTNPGTCNVNTTQNILKISGLTTNGYVKTSGSDGTLGVQAVPIPFADGGTGTTTNYAKGLFYGDGSILRQPTGSGAAILNWDNTNGRLGIGTSSPMDSLSVAGNVQSYGTFHHFGSAAALAPCNTTMASTNCLEIVGNDNTTGGVGEYISNINAGASAYSGLTLMNTLIGNATTNYSGLFLNSASYADTTFGSANNFPNLLQLGNSMGGVSIQSFAPTAAASFINFVTASTTPGQGPSTNSIDMTITAAGRIGIGTTTPASKVDITSTTTDATGSAFSVRELGTKIFDVASTSAISGLGIGTTTQNTVDTVFSVQGNSAGSATKGTCFRYKQVAQNGANIYAYGYISGGASPTQTITATSCSGVGTTTITYD